MQGRPQHIRYLLISVGSSLEIGVEKWTLPYYRLKRLKYVPYLLTGLFYSL